MLRRRLLIRRLLRIKVAEEWVAGEDEVADEGVAE